MKTLKTSANVEYPAIPPPPKAPPQKSVDAATATPDAPKATEKSTTPAEGGNNTLLFVAIGVSAVLFVGGGYLLLSALRKSKGVEDVDEAVEEEPEVKKKPYVSRAVKPEPEVKPARAKPPAPKSKSKTDDNPFANFS